MDFEPPMSGDVARTCPSQRAGGVTIWPQDWYMSEKRSKPYLSVSAGKTIAVRSKVPSEV
jgi:hypothetical protein